MNNFGSKMFLVLSVLLVFMLCFGVVSASDDIDGGAVLAVDDVKAVEESASFDGVDGDVLASADDDDDDVVGSSGNESVLGAGTCYVSPGGSGTGSQGNPASWDYVVSNYQNVDNVVFLDGEYNITK